jgi:cytoskeletal protein RodZ
METLIDNRIFPQEMQEKPKSKDEKPQKKNMSSNILISLLLIVILGLVYYILIYKNRTPKTIPLTYPQEQALVVETLERTNVQMSPEERQQRINAFFGNE